MQKIEKLINSLFQMRVSLIGWMISFASIIALRLFLDKFIADSTSPIVDPIMDLHNLFFFLLAFLMIWLVLSLVLKTKPQKLSGLMTVSSLVILLPPVLDMLKTSGKVYWSFYLLSYPKDLWWQFITVFGHLPSGIMYFGTKIAFVLAIVFLGAVVFLKTKNLWKAFVSAVGAYLALFMMGAFPSLFAYGYYFWEGSRSVASVGMATIAQFFSNVSIFGVALEDPRYALVYNLNFIYFLLVILLSGMLFFRDGKEKFFLVIKNARYPQLIYHSGLLLAGAGLGFLAYPENFNLNIFSFAALLVLLVSVWLAWKASVVVNDIYDFRIDQITNPSRPLQSGQWKREEYQELGIAFFILSLIGGFIIGVEFGVLLLVYQLLAWFYSASPFRLKRFPLVATFVSACASLLILFLGFLLFSGEEGLSGLSSRIIFLLLLTYTIGLPIKDFKDIEGDRKDGVWTIPVILGETKGRLLIASAFFISFMASVFVLNEMRLFFWALLFGGIAFFVINHKKIKPRTLPWWGLGIIFIYGLILVKMIFV